MTGYVQNVTDKIGLVEFLPVSYSAPDESQTMGTLTQPRRLGLQGPLAAGVLSFEPGLPPLGSSGGSPGGAPQFAFLPRCSCWVWRVTPTRCRSSSSTACRFSTN